MGALSGVGAMREQARKRPLVHWQGRQWAVTSLGIESIATQYPVRISKRRLGRVAHDMNGYQFVQEVLANRWLDVSDFWEAWEQACVWHNECFNDMPFTWRSLLVRRTREAFRQRLADAALSEMAASTTRSGSRTQRVPKLRRTISRGT